MSALGLFRKFATLLFIIVFTSLSYKGFSKAIEVLNTSQDCADVLAVFARGSSDNPLHDYLDRPFNQRFEELEKVSGAFFRNIKEELDVTYPNITYKAVSVHNFPDLYNDRGYRAVGIFGGPTVNNMVNAEFSWWPWGEYRESVSDGAEEVVGYLTDQQLACPDQQIILGGYSQGANVIGDALFMLDQGELEKIGAVALFGDPKYVGSDVSKDASSLNWFDQTIPFLSKSKKPKAAPWARGSATLNDRGSLEARVPYVSVGMEQKMISWCFNDDFVCAGGSGLLQTIGRELDKFNLVTSKDQLGEGHSRYPTFGVPQAVEEALFKIAPHLYTKDVSRGGFDKDAGPTANQVSARTTPTEALLMVNTSAGVNDVVGTIALASSRVVSSVLKVFPHASIGIGDYSEYGYFDRRIPRASVHLYPTREVEKIEKAAVQKLSFGALSGGGIDTPDPHQIAVERASMRMSRKPDITKHLILITDRPFHDTYTYNICNSDVRISFEILTPNACNNQPALESDLSWMHPERCKDAYQVFSSDYCSVGLTQPSPTYNVIRTKFDATTFAVMNNVAVSVIIPHTPNTPLSAAQKFDLKKLTSDTGGIFVEYESFSIATYIDLLWKVLSHTPKRLPLAMIANFDQASSYQSEPISVAEAKTYEPIRLTANHVRQFAQYQWDFNGDGAIDETTEAPFAEHVYTEPVDGLFASVRGINHDESTMLGLLPINISEGDIPAEKAPPSLPASVSANRNGDEVVVGWDVADYDDTNFTFIGDETGSPIKSIVATAGAVSIDDGANQLKKLTIWIENSDGRSERQMIEVVSAQHDDTETVQTQPAQDTRAPSDKIIAVSESNTLPETFSGAVADEATTQQDSLPVVVTEERPVSGSVTGQELQQAGVTQVRGEDTRSTTNPQQAAAVSQTQLASEFDSEPIAEKPMNILPVVLGGFVAITLLAGSAVIIKITRAKR